ncbi:MAG: glycosyltransferase family 4 protein [Aquincola sp.]|nr:glycosyltransferase family 4 protein [Aquincola sp.]
MRIAYLINQYPTVSHSFIRREIVALERAGVAVTRVSVRGWIDKTASAADADERLRTRYLLQGGAGPLIKAMLLCLLQRPMRFVRAFASALRFARGSLRPLPLHMVYLAEACLLREWLSQAGCSHLHAHFGTNAAEVAYLCHRLGGPGFSFTVHGPEEFDMPAALHIPEKVRQARFVVAISSFGRSQLLRWISAADWAKVRVVHCGLDGEFLAQALTPPPPAPQLVCVGRLCEQKGQLLLLRAVHRLREQGTRLQLVLAGDGEMRPQIEALIAELGISDQVRITGWIGGPTVRQEILDARALVLPSFAEGLPVVLMEAMALGRPVITTYIAGIPELVTHGQTGWLIPAGDVQALAGASRRCLPS